MLKAQIELLEDAGEQAFTCGPDRLISWEDEDGDYIYFLEALNPATRQWERRDHADSLGEGISLLLEAIDFRQVAQPETKIPEWKCPTCGSDELKESGDRDWEGDDSYWDELHCQCGEYIIATYQAQLASIAIKD